MIKMLTSVLWDSASLVSGVSLLLDLNAVKGETIPISFLRSSMTFVDNELENF